MIALRKTFYTAAALYPTDGLLLGSSLGSGHSGTLDQVVCQLIQCIEMFMGGNCVRLL